MTDRARPGVPEDEKAFHRIVAKSWLDPTLRDGLRSDPARALGVARLTADEQAAVSRFLDEDVEEPQSPMEPSAAGQQGPPRPQRDNCDRFDLGGLAEDRSSDTASAGDPEFAMELPRLAGHFSVRGEPADSSGADVLHFVSSRRSLRFEGRNLTAFHEVVLPLLDGRHTLAAIETACAPRFRRDELHRGLQLLASHRLLHDAGTDAIEEPTRTRLAPQLNFLHELGFDAQQKQARLSSATVSLIGLSGAGATAALSLAAAQVGSLRCIDAQPVSAADPLLAAAFATESVGLSRADTVAELVKATAPDVKVSACTKPLDTDQEVRDEIAGSDLVLCFVDPGLASLTYKVNRACLDAGISWIACSVTGFEGVLGPIVKPYETACYLCYKMREAACSERPDDALAHLEFLDARRSDDGGIRENTPFSAGVVGNLMALEAFKQLSGIADDLSLGRITVLDFLRLTATQHLVVRKPDCPACAER